MLVALCLAGLQAVADLSVRPPPDPAAIPRLAVTTGWLGNTLLRGPWNDAQQTWLQLYTSDVAVSPDGFVYLTTTWEEGLRAAGIYRHGDALPAVARYGVNSGRAVAVGTGLVAYARTRQVSRQPVRTLSLHPRTPGHGIGTNAPPRDLPLPQAAGDVLGLALDETRDRVYFSDGTQVAAVRLRSGRPDDGFPPVKLDRAGRLAVDGAGRVWVVQMPRRAATRRLPGRPFASAPRLAPRGPRLGAALDGDPADAAALPFEAADPAGFYGLDFGTPVPVAGLRFSPGAGDSRFREVWIEGATAGPGGPWERLATFADRPCGWPEEWLTLDPAVPWRCLRVVGPEIKVNLFEAHAPDPAQPGCVRGFTPEGQPHGPGIDTVATPVDVAWDAVHDRLLIASQEPDHQVCAFTGLADKPRPDARFAGAGRLGVAGGWWAGPAAEAGRTGPGRFAGLRGLGVDAAGHVAVCGVGDHGHGQTFLESYAPDGTRLWRMEGLSFLDHADVDPDDPSALFSTVNRYRMDWSATEGNGWSWAAGTLDSQRFPDDPRLHGSALTYGVRRIHGARFLVTTTQHAAPLCVFRFDPAVAGEAAVPCALVCGRNTGRPWPPHQPLGFGPFLWRDTNGDGRFQADEYEKLLRDEAEIRWMEIDAAGDLWLAGHGQRTNRLWRVSAGRRLGAHGIPAWSLRASLAGAFALPPPFETGRGVRLGGLEVDGSAREAYLFGFTPALTNACGMNYPLGRLLLRCRIEADRLVPTHAVELAHNVTLGTRPRDQAYCAALAGDYLFVGYVQHMTVLVYRREDLALVGRLDAGPQSPCPIFDGPPELVAHHLPDGDYALFMPQYQGNAVTVLRWGGTTTPRLPEPLPKAAREGGGITVAWDGVAGATGWQLERRVCTVAGWGRWEPGVTLPASAHSHRDRDAAMPAVAYRLRATGEGGTRSDWSRTVYVREGGGR